MRKIFKSANPVAFFAVVVVGFLLFPLVAILPISFSSSTLLRLPPPGYSLQWYRAIWSDPGWIDATRNSVVVGVSTAVASVLIGMATAYGLACSTWRGKAAIQALILSPLLLPVIVIAVATYHFFSLIGLNGTFTGLIVGHTMITFPYTVVVISAALERVDPRLEQIALSLGASRFRAFVNVTFPLIRAGVLVAFLFAFLNSFDEVVMATFVAGPETTTLPKRLWDGVRFELSPVIAAVSSILIVISCAVVGVTEIVDRKSRMKEKKSGTLL
jgi:putative spermidine/putrescine transport system permease protein